MLLIVILLYHSLLFFSPPVLSRESEMVRRCAELAARLRDAAHTEIMKIPPRIRNMNINEFRKKYPNQFSGNRAHQSPLNHAKIARKEQQINQVTSASSASTSTSTIQPTASSTETSPLVSADELLSQFATMTREDIIKVRDKIAAMLATQDKQ